MGTGDQVSRKAWVRSNTLAKVLRRTVSTRRNSFSVIATGLVVAMVGAAAVSITYNTSSTETLSLLAPPIIWVAGPDSSGNDHVASMSVSSNATYFTVTLKPVPEANVSWANLTSLKNQGSTAKTVTVSGTNVSGYSKVLQFQLEFYEHGTGTLLGILNLDSNTQSLSLGSRSAGSQAYVKQWIKLDDGTAQGDLPSTVTISLTIA